MKKLLILILTIICSLSSAAAFSACDFFGTTDEGEKKEETLPDGGDKEPDGEDKKPDNGDKIPDDHKHEYNLKIDPKPTASKGGTAKSVCTCGDIESTVNLPALGDSRYNKGKDTATCGKGGSVKYTISVNGGTYMFDVATPATGKHTYVEGKCACGATDPNYTPHSHSYVAKSDERGHWTECSCGDKTELKEHKYTYGKDESEHWKVCSVGNETVEREAHTYNNGVCVCGKPDPHVHSYVAKSDGRGHWTECACGSKTTLIPHSWSYGKDGSEHWQICSVGNETTEKVPHDVAAADCVCGKEKPANELAYALSDDKSSYEVIGIGTVSSSDIAIPATYNGLPVTVIKSYAFKDCEAAQIIIPASVVEIEHSAFSNCKRLQSLVFEDTNAYWEVSHIKMNVGAAQGQTPLANPLYDIGSMLVSKSDYLSPYDALDSGLISDDALMAEIFAKPSKAMSENKLDFPVLGDIVMYGSGGRYTDDTTFTAVVDDEERPAVLELGFKKSNKVIVNGVNYSVNSSGGYTVNGVSGAITYLVIPATIGGKPVTMIADEAFKGNASLKSVTVPATASIGKSAFENCANLKTFTMQSASAKSFSRRSKAVVVTDAVIGYKAFENSGISEITIADTVKEIDFAFGGCDKLTRVNYTGTVGGWASIYMHGVGCHILAVARGLYIDGQRVKDVVVDNIEEFGLGFVYSDITSVKIGGGVKRVNGSAFESCEELLSVEIADGVEMGLHSTFRFCVKLESVTLPSDMKIISQSMFEGCKALKEIDLPDGLTHIDDMAFRDSGLTSIVIPASVVRIGAYAFEYCYDLGGLQSIVFEDTAKNWNIAARAGAFASYDDIENEIVSGMDYEFIVNDSLALNDWLYSPADAAKILSNTARSDNLHASLMIYDRNTEDRKFYNAELSDNGYFVVNADGKIIEFTIAYCLVKPNVDNINGCGWHTSGWFPAR